MGLITGGGGAVICLGRQGRHFVPILDGARGKRKLVGTSRCILRWRASLFPSGLVYAQCTRTRRPASCPVHHPPDARVLPLLPHGPAPAAPPRCAAGSRARRRDGRVVPGGGRTVAARPFARAQGDDARRVGRTRRGGDGRRGDGRRGDGLGGRGHGASGGRAGGGGRKAKAEGEAAVAEAARGAGRRGLGRRGLGRLGRKQFRTRGTRGRGRGRRRGGGRGARARGGRPRARCPGLAANRVAHRRSAPSGRQGTRPTGHRPAFGANDAQSPHRARHRGADRASHPLPYARRTRTLRRAIAALCRRAGDDLPPLGALLPQTQADVPQDPGGVAGRVGESVGEGEEGVVAGRGEGGGVIRPSRYPFLLLAPRRATPQQGIFAELPGFARTGENVFDGAGGPRFWRHKHPELGEALCAIGLGPDYAHRATFFGGLLSDGAVGMSRGEAAAAFARCLGAPTLSDGDRRLIVGEYADRFETYFKHLGLFEALADLGLWTPPADFVRKILTFGPPPLSDASSDPDDRQTIDLSDPARRGAFRLLHLALTKLGLPAAPQDLALAVRLAKASGPLPGARGPVRLLIHSGADADSPIVKQAVLEGPRYAGFKADKEEARCWRRWAEAGSLGGLPAELVERIALERWEGDCCAGGDL